MRTERWKSKFQILTDGFNGNQFYKMLLTFNQITNNSLVSAAQTLLSVLHHCKLNIFGLVLDKMRHLKMWSSGKSYYYRNFMPLL